MIPQATGLWRVSHKVFILLQKTSLHLPAVKNIRMWSNLQAGFDWLHRMTSKCSITFKYSVFSLTNIYFLIFWMLLHSWVLWCPNPQASVTHGTVCSVTRSAETWVSNTIKTHQNGFSPFLFWERNRIIQDLQQQLLAFTKYYFPPPLPGISPSNLLDCLTNLCKFFNENRKQK